MDNPALTARKSLACSWNPAADLALSAPGHLWGCSCALHQRRRFSSLVGAAIAIPLTSCAASAPIGPASAASGPAPEGVRDKVGKESKFTQLVPAAEVENAARLQYAEMKQEAASKHAVAPDNYPQVIRLRAIAQRIIPFTYAWNARAQQWKWEINLFGSQQLNAFCMPGGKIAFYHGILEKLQLNDDEVAVVMGHEMAHALREHAREQMGKSTATQIGAGLVSALLGLGEAGNAAMNIGTQLLSLKFGREDESEADLVGLDLAARAGYDPAAGISLWQKMMKTSAGAPPEFLSTHPSGPTRIDDIRAVLPRVMPLYQRAAKPTQRFAPPEPTPAKG